MLTVKNQTIGNKKMNKISGSHINYTILTGSKRSWNPKHTIILPIRTDKTSMYTIFWLKVYDLVKYTGGTRYACNFSHRPWLRYPWRARYKASVFSWPKKIKFSFMKLPFLSGRKLPFSKSDRFSREKVPVYCHKVAVYFRKLPFRIFVENKR